MSTLAWTAKSCALRASVVRTLEYAYPPVTVAIAATLAALLVLEATAQIGTPEGNARGRPH